tara:strand:- start:90 stop:398 length:309 start_codon:yes stop_codon:yes gene_type:complete
MRDITSNDFTIMESDSEEFYAFRIDTGIYKDVIFRFGKVSGKDTSAFGKDAKIDFSFVALKPNEKYSLEELDKDAKFGILAGKVLKHMLETSIDDLKKTGQL